MCRDICPMRRRVRTLPVTRLRAEMECEVSRKISILRRNFETLARGMSRGSRVHVLENAFRFASNSFKGPLNKLFRSIEGRFVAESDCWLLLLIFSGVLLGCVSRSTARDIFHESE